MIVVVLRRRYILGQRQRRLRQWRLYACRAVQVLKARFDRPFRAPFLGGEGRHELPCQGVAREIATRRSRKVTDRLPEIRSASAVHLVWLDAGRFWARSALQWYLRTAGGAGTDNNGCAADDDDDDDDAYGAWCGGGVGGGGRVPARTSMSLRRDLIAPSVRPKWAASADTSCRTWTPPFKWPSLLHK